MRSDGSNPSNEFGQLALAVIAVEDTLVRPTERAIETVAYGLQTWMGRMVGI